MRSRIFGGVDFLKPLNEIISVDLHAAPADAEQDEREDPGHESGEDGSTKEWFCRTLLQGSVAINKKKKLSKPACGASRRRRG